MAMVMNYYGHDRTPEALAPKVFSPDANGSFPTEMDALARSEGFLSYPVSSIEELMQEIAAGHPVLVLQNLGVSWYKVWHFSVIIGYDRDRDVIIERSGNQFRQETPMRVFNATWQRSQYWGRTILPAGTLPASAQLLPYMKAASDLEQTGQTLAAKRAYQSAACHWPEHPLPPFALGNFYQAQQQPQKAAPYYERLLKLQPDFAAGWNNAAYNRLELGCKQAALAAAQCAMKLVPDHSDYSDSANEIDQSNPVSTCAIQSFFDCPVN